jgi:ABC-type dipeptide transport system, periplasmic component
MSTSSIPLTVKLALKTPFSPLIAQLTDRAGMIVSPKAAKAEGDKFGLKPVCAGPYKFVERVQQDRIVFEKFADYWDKDKIKIDRIVYLPLVDATVRLANLKSGGLDLIERLLATDIKAVQSDPKLKLSTAIEIGYQGVTLNVGKDKTKGRSASPQSAPGARSFDRPRGHQPGGVQRRVQARQPVGQPRSPLLPKKPSRSAAATSPRPRRY